MNLDDTIKEDSGIQLALIRVQEVHHCRKNDTSLLKRGAIWKERRNCDQDNILEIHADMTTAKSHVHPL